MRERESKERERGASEIRERERAVCLVRGPYSLTPLHLVQNTASAEVKERGREGERKKEERGKRERERKRDRRLVRLVDGGLFRSF